MKGVSLLFSTVFLLHACRQGTEVGNGARTNPKPSSTSGNNAGSSDSPTMGEKADSAGDITLPDPLRFLTSTCASPLAEPMQGRFVNESYADAVVITSDSMSGQKRMVSRTQEFQIVPAPTATEPFAIQVTPTVGLVRCSLVTSQVQSDGSTVRSVALDGVRNLSWTLEQGQVQSFRIQDTSNSQSFEFRLDTTSSGL